MRGVVAVLVTALALAGCTKSAVDSEATRMIVAAKNLTPAAADYLNAIYSDEEFTRQVDRFAEDLRLGGIRPSPGNRVTTVERIIGASPSCVWLAVRRDYSAVNFDPGPRRVCRPLLSTAWRDRRRLSTPGATERASKSHAAMQPPGPFSMPPSPRWRANRMDHPVSAFAGVPTRTRWRRRRRRMRRTRCGAWRLRRSRCASARRCRRRRRRRRLRSPAGGGGGPAPRPAPRIAPGYMLAGKLAYLEAGTVPMVTFEHRTRPPSGDGGACRRPTTGLEVLTVAV